MNALIVNASARVARSLTREQAQLFVERLKIIHPNCTITTRDVGQKPPPHVSSEWIAAAFKPRADRTVAEDQALEESDRLIAEVSMADVIVIATPMYNYGMPSSLKAWFDQVIRVNETFDFDLARGDHPITPRLSGKSVVLLTACGEFGFETGGVRQSMGHLVPHLKTASRYLGAAHVFHAGIEYQEFDDHRHQRSRAKALAEIPCIADAVKACFDGG